MLDIVDAIRVLLEPTPVAGLNVHDNAASPLLTDADTGNGDKHLWVYTVSDDHEIAGAGTPMEERERFAIDAMYIMDDQREKELGMRLRTISVALDAKAHAYTAICAANRHHPTLWSELETSLSVLEDWRGLDVRGFVLHMSGYRVLIY